MDKEFLVKEYIVKNCDLVYAKKPELNTICVSGGKIIERCLFFYYDQMPELQGNSRPNNLNTLINILAINDASNFPLKYLGFCQLARQNSNMQKHGSFNKIDEIQLYTYRIGMYLFLNWFMKEYLRLNSISTAENWYKDNVLNNNVINLIMKKNIKHEVSKEDIVEYKKKIKHQENIIEMMRKREINLTEKLNNSKL